MTADREPQTEAGWEAATLAAPAPPPAGIDVERLREALSTHYVTAIECDHEAQTDTVRCNCSVWTGTAQPALGAAVSEWVDHVLTALPLAESEYGRLPLARLAPQPTADPEP